MNMKLFRRGVTVIMTVAASLYGSVAIAQPYYASERAAQPVLVAVGDSVAAGAGLPVGAGASDAACARSGQAYVTQVARNLGMQPLNLACSGATSWNSILTDQSAGGLEVPSQLKQLRQGPVATTAVVTIGANDVRWVDFLRACAATNCATDQYTQAFNIFKASARVGLASSLRAMRYYGVERTFVTGYYDPFASSGYTPAQLGFSPEETAWYQARLASLNAQIAEVSANAGATYVPLDFSGSPYKLVQGATDPAPFHPTAAGQSVIAGAVTRAAR